MQLYFHKKLTVVVQLRAVLGYESNLALRGFLINVNLSLFSLTLVTKSHGAFSAWLQYISSQAYLISLYRNMKLGLFEFLTAYNHC